jgi:glycerol kinase
MRADWPEAQAAQVVLRVDGGMTASDWTMQRLSDLLDMPVDRPVIQETTALGAAYLAGLAAGVYPEPANSQSIGGSIGVSNLRWMRPCARKSVTVGRGP